ncbi:ArsR family transcriptional regulator [Shewanella sp. KT0246]|uniref:ArsR family transcriptional regulator n=1 Tax=Shewanella sp. KT0246 TaxID=2815912 RepID=UPI001BC768E6|nr:ArsR family transcriptional regulator [Shewanella sp. KT0246]GIU53719.1 hypothetical protein TUM4249_33600 [Shewanella sp. KT0246]
MNKIIYKILVLLYAALCFCLAIKGMPAELAGFAAAGALALVFLNLEAFAEFSGAGFSAKLNQRIETIEKDMEPIKSKATEPEISAKPEMKNGETDSIQLDEDKLKILDALIDGKYSWRTITGLCQDTKISRDNLSELLTELEAEGLVTASKSAAGKVIWGSTMRGNIFHSIERHATFE